MFFNSQHIGQTIPQEILDNITQLLTSLSAQLRQSISDVNADFDSFYYRLESIIQVLSRLATNGPLLNEDEIFSKLYAALEQLDLRNVPAQPVQPLELISQEQLQYLLEHRFTVPEMSAFYGVSVRTIRRRMTHYGLFVRQTYSDINDDELQKLVSDFIVNCPNTGYKVITGHLHSLGLR